jgi:hypothetical protein
MVNFAGISSNIRRIYTVLANPNYCTHILHFTISASPGGADFHEMSNKYCVHKYIDDMLYTDESVYTVISNKYFLHIYEDDFQP